MTSEERSFEAAIEVGLRSGGALVEVPPDVEEALRGHAWLKGTFDGYPFKGAIVFSAGRPVLGVTRTVREAIGKDVGDRVSVAVAVDDDPSR
jgi:hypothetical protein